MTSVKIKHVNSGRYLRLRNALPYYGSAYTDTTIELGENQAGTAQTFEVHPYFSNEKNTGGEKQSTMYVVLTVPFTQSNPSGLISTVIGADNVGSAVMARNFDKVGNRICFSVVPKFSSGNIEYNKEFRLVVPNFLDGQNLVQCWSTLENGQSEGTSMIYAMFGGDEPQKLVFERA